MCGITGYWEFSARPDPDARQRIGRMAQTIVHRGPDEDGFQIHDNGGPVFGFRRLSIIDLTTGSQPMTSADGRYSIVFNGEIYNYVELRAELEQQGTRFRTSSDTEVILELFSRHGPTDSIRRLRGMFGFALWDSKARRLLLARDRFGKKPLYYYRDEHRLVFGSEIKAILEHESVPRRVNLRALDNFLSWMAVPEPDTMFQGIHKLRPGHLAVFEADGSQQTSQYWDLSFPRRQVWDPEEAGERMLVSLEESVRLRLRSDVPVGVLLSGGVDSSAIVALAAQAAGRVSTFSVGFAEEGFSELRWARMVAERYATDHHEIEITPQDYWGFLDDLVWHLDEPMSDLATIPLYHVCKMANQHVKVLLSGEGSDEMFGGYVDRYRTAIGTLGLGERLGGLTPRWARRLVERHIGSGMAPTSIWRGLVQSVSVPFELRFLQQAIYVYYGDLRNSLYRGPLQGFENQNAELRRTILNGDGKDLLQRLLYVDCKVNLPDYLLMKADKMSMAASIELRCPFLDHEFAQLCASIPSELKLRGREGKWLLKKQLEHLLPHEVLYRPKMGFPVPLDNWLRDGLKERVSGILFDSSNVSSSLFDSSFVRDMWNAHQEGRQQFHLQLWVLVLFELWCRRFDVDVQVGEEVAA